jgi:hypothetical protein
LLRGPHLKLLAKPDKSDLISEAGMPAEIFRDHDPPVAVDGENLNIAVERDRKLVSLVRIIRQA